MVKRFKQEPSLDAKWGGGGGGYEKQNTHKIFT